MDSPIYHLEGVVKAKTEDMEDFVGPLDLILHLLSKNKMEIKDIQQFMDWCVEGPATYPQRKAMFEAQRVHMEAELEQMNRTLDMLKFKCWYYEQAIKDGSEDRLKALIPDHLPDGIRKAYENAHS